MIKKIETEIGRYFPKKWREKDAAYFIGKPRFQIDINALNGNFNEPARDFIFRGGKRWRPVLFLLTLKLFGTKYENYLDIASAIELAHNATLIIDDIEDNASLRRGRPACHKIFGVDTAVNSGVLLHLLPLNILLKSKLTKQRRAKLYQIYAEEIINVYFGQTIDISWHKKFPKNIGVEKYMEMCRLKTGGLARMALRMACVLSGKNGEVERKFARFGELLGIAFQIKDDVLDLTADGGFGKSYGNDIIEGKISLPVVLAIKSLNPAEKKRLIKILGLRAKTEKSISEAIRLIKKSGAIEKSLKYADELAEKSWKSIEKNIPKGPAKEKFKEITYFSVKRNY